MAWGGGGFGSMGGGHGGGLGHHPGGHRPGQPVAGLPFAGIPSEMAEGVRALLAGEPEHPEPEVGFSHRAPAGRGRFTLATLLRPHWRAMALAVALVVVETVSLQVGPQLTQRAIDDGMLEGDFGVVVLMAGLYLASVVANGLFGAVRVAWTGRVGQRLMYAVRVRVFTHLQRLSLDFFT
ncbi:MAG TPA: ABC transporter transmembrane domain-containing protein, partial [Acidimicrobiales bacterium]|nr:ABC transporter transmembrane domain-containing protein [Acidimicrobiales bacterium]